MNKTARIPLVEERKRRGWSQQEMADLVGTTQHNVSRWEAGQTTPGPYFRAKLCTLFGKQAQELGLIEVEDEKDLNGNQKNEEKIHDNEATVEPAAPSQPVARRGTLHILLKGKASRRWALLAGSLLLVCLLILTLGIWRFSENGRAPGTGIPGNPYTGKGTLVLNDTLAANGAAGWSLNNNDYGQCFFADGTYRIRDTRSAFMKVCVAAETYFTDFTYEVKMQIVAGDCGGLAFRITFPQLYYFLICQDGRYRFVRYDRDHPANIRIITSGISPAIYQGFKRTNVIAVEATGETFALYINHQLIYSGTDQAYLDGQIGLIAHTCSITYLDQRPDVCAAPVEAVFQDAKVWKSDSI